MLAAHGIPCTSCPASLRRWAPRPRAGLPLTHRRLAHSVTLRERPPGRARRLTTGASSPTRATPWCSTWASRSCRASSRGCVPRARRGASGRAHRARDAAASSASCAARLADIARSRRAAGSRRARAARRRGRWPPSLPRGAAALALPEAAQARWRERRERLRRRDRQHAAASVCARASEATGCEILGKAEFMNPGGSVKDRAARAIVAAAEERGELPPGGTVVEGTAGNTGIGLAHVCNARGYRCVIVMPDNQSAGEVPPARDARRRGAQGPGRSLQQSEPVPEGRRSASPPRSPARSGPTSSTTPPTATPTCAPPDRRSGRRPTGASMPSWPRPARAARSPGWREYLKSPHARGALRAGRPAGQQPVRLRAQRHAARRPAAARSPRASASAASPPTSQGAPIDDAVHDRGRRDRALGLPAAARGRPVPRQHQRHQRRRGGAAWRASSGPGNDRHGAVRRRCQISVASVQPRMARAEGARRARSRTPPALAVLQRPWSPSARRAHGFRKWPARAGRETVAAVTDNSRAPLPSDGSPAEAPRSSRPWA